ncbi:hypothetical protein CH063_14280 [Colletotrichum higginsianum]|uniref:Uncharacterized protein n=1 Tax=Colletotrichum higginsianum (strain IMI 349063) TaxID=759273 RepID=H1VXW6_COLHI|nr:hypothetical protein CH063_14280 [Colletotrichum higginsianum]
MEARAALPQVADKADGTAMFGKRLWVGAVGVDEEMKELMPAQRRAPREIPYPRKQGPPCTATCRGALGTAAKDGIAPAGSCCSGGERGTSAEASSCLCPLCIWKSSYLAYSVSMITTTIEPSVSVELIQQSLSALRVCVCVCVCFLYHLRPGVTDKSTGSIPCGSWPPPGLSRHKQRRHRQRVTMPSGDRHLFL